MKCRRTTARRALGFQALVNWLAGNKLAPFGAASRRVWNWLDRRSRDLSRPGGAPP